MGVSRCSQGHFYEDDKYDSCPYCGNVVHMDRSPEAVRKAVEEKAREQTTVGKGQQGDRREQKTVAKQKEDAFNEQKTVAKGVKQNKTQGVVAKQMGMDPVCGWLVCTKGPHRGRDFKLRSGKNFIGRSAGMDVPLTEENDIARHNHAAIIYEPKKNIFLLMPIGGTSVTLNGEVLLEPKEINSYDILTLGGTELDFIAYCIGEKKWKKE